jgi:hypothetical protein
MFQFAKFEKSKERRLATELGYGFPVPFHACTLFFGFNWGMRLSGIAPLQITFNSVPALIFESLGGFRVSRSNFGDNGPFFKKWGT